MPMPSSANPSPPARLSIQRDGGHGRTTPVILVVDDDEYVHQTLAAALRRLGSTVIRAVSAAEGLDLALQYRPNVAIIDVGLPDADGFELTRSLRAQAGLESLRIVILTGYVPEPELASDAGADAIVGKPFRLHEFLATIESQLAVA